MKAKNYYAKYEKLSNDAFEQLKAQYLKQIEKARYPEDAHHIFIETVMKPRMGQLAVEMDKLGTTKNFLQRLDDTYRSDNTKEKPEIFNAQIEEIEPSKRDESVKLLAEHQVQVLMDEFWHDESKKQQTKEQNEIQNEILFENKSGLIWKVDNETEFVQFAYALHKAGYLEHEKKTIKDLVPDLARMFNFPLGKNWYVNHSSSIHKRKFDTKREIFDNLKKAYEKYREEQINKKKKN